MERWWGVRAKSSMDSLQRAPPLGVGGEQRWPKSQAPGVQRRHLRPSDLGQAAPWGLDVIRSKMRTQRPCPPTKQGLGKVPNQDRRQRCPPGCAQRPGLGGRLPDPLCALRLGPRFRRHTERAAAPRSPCLHPAQKKKKSASRAPARPAPLLRAGLHANCFSPLGLLPPSSVTAKALLVASTPPCDLSRADLCARPPAALRTATRLRTSAAQRSARASCAPRSGPALARRGAFTRLFPLPGTPFPTFPRAPRHASLRSQLSPLPPPPTSCS